MNELITNPVLAIGVAFCIAGAVTVIACAFALAKAKYAIHGLLGMISLGLGHLLVAAGSLCELMLAPKFLLSTIAVIGIIAYVVAAIDMMRCCRLTNSEK